jgi:hypothetical protein
VVVSTVEVSAVAGFVVAAASAEGLSMAPVVLAGDVSAVVLSTVVAFAVAVLAGATGAITDSLMMSSLAASGFRDGGAGAIRTDIPVTAITRTITMDTAAGTRTAMVTARTVTTVAPVTGIAMEAERAMDMAVAAEPVTHNALAADPGMSGVRGAGDKPR